MLKMKCVNMYYVILLLAVLTLCSCSTFDSDESDYPSNYYDPEHYISEAYFMPLMDANDVANIYGMANGYNTISVIASGSMFEVSCLPQDMFLDSFPGGSVYAEGGNISVLRDVIPYTHEEFRIPDQDRQVKMYQLSFPEHSMTYKVQQGESLHDVCMTFGKADGVTEFCVMGGHHYWVYRFTMEIVGMTVDGVEHPLPAKRSIEYNFYYNRFKDTI